ncbi:MAG: ABC transporter ATP-binding protein [Chloroflexi bacterium]|nr:ABC transporter ATP-binding protein [Chloroflexota bacterium]MDA8187956.1 ABC transporter ATP-binding protein [Dehalococcoidales bacterium]
MKESPAAPVLAVRDVTVSFGGLLALSHVHLEIPAGARHGILGPNGSGKTTLFNVITGFVAPTSGSIVLRGIDATRLPPHRRVQLGLARTFQITTLFPLLTALDNVLMGALVKLGNHRGVWRAASQDKEARAVAAALLAELGLEHLAQRAVRDLGYGEQRQLEIAVALAAGPRVLLLDEPTAGLSAAETEMVSGLIRRLSSELTVVLIEHDLEVIFELADHLTVLYNGERIADGPAQVIREDPVVKGVYLGGN